MKWDATNINEFYDKLLSYKRDDKILWTQNIVNTKKKCLGIPFPDLRIITKDILKTDYISFLDLMPNQYHEALLIDALLINKIKDFKTQTKYINKLAKYIDSWSVVDTLKFNISKYPNEYFGYAKKLLTSKKPFERRIAIRIFFSYIKTDYIDEIFNILDGLEEDHYYVNMAIAWFLCEGVIKNRDKTINYLKQSKLNAFAINKAISKCHDSFRVIDRDKKLLNKYKKNTSN
ncbi:MAG: DNA alkylation repair protein [Bacilli bacterium]|nr:DNA alkylation repair protein [Bacilli bacterium]